MSYLHTTAVGLNTDQRWQFKTIRPLGRGASHLQKGHRFKSSVFKFCTRHRERERPSSSWTQSQPDENGFKPIVPAQPRRKISLMSLSLSLLSSFLRIRIFFIFFYFFNVWIWDYVSFGILISGFVWGWLIFGLILIFDSGFTKLYSQLMILTQFS